PDAHLLAVEAFFKKRRKGFAGGFVLLRRSWGNTGHVGKNLFSPELALSGQVEQKGGALAPPTLRSGPASRPLLLPSPGTSPGSARPPRRSKAPKNRVLVNPAPEPGERPRGSCRARPAPEDHGKGRAD